MTFWEALIIITSFVATLGMCGALYLVLDRAGLIATEYSEVKNSAPTPPASSPAKPPSDPVYPRTGEGGGLRADTVRVECRICCTVNDIPSQTAVVDVFKRQCDFCARLGFSFPGWK